MVTCAWDVPARAAPLPAAAMSIAGSMTDGRAEGGAELAGVAPAEGLSTALDADAREANDRATRECRAAMLHPHSWASRATAWGQGNGG